MNIDRKSTRVPNFFSGKKKNALTRMSKSFYRENFRRNVEIQLFRNYFYIIFLNKEHFKVVALLVSWQNVQ